MQSHMTNDLLIHGENISAFPHILRNPYSYMTLHPIPSEFPYIRGKFCLLFYLCRELTFENPFHLTFLNKSNIFLYTYTVLTHVHTEWNDSDIGLVVYLSLSCWQQKSIMPIIEKGFSCGV